MSWFSDLIDWITRTRTVDFLLTPPLHGPTAVAPIAPNTYLRVRVASLRLPNTREHIFNTLYGVVHAFGTVNRFGTAPAKFVSATLPNELAGVAPHSLGNIVSVNRVVIGPTPYIGGDFELQIGLFSVVDENLAGPFVDTLTGISKQIGTGFAAAAAPYIDVLQMGMQAFSKASGSVTLEVGLDDTLPAPQTGTYALVAADKGEFDKSKFTLDPSDMKLLYNGDAYTDKPYFVFTIESLTQRPDWGSIPELSTAYAAITRAIGARDEKTARDALGGFRVIALTNGELIQTDANRIVLIVQQLVDAAFPPAAPGAPRIAATLAAREVPAFHELKLYDA